ncbi:MAG: aminopeptidase P family protein [Chitinophagaceae bacterium]|nr:aminopeptidase P family protein [Chitinophagaceae bacterium]
MKRRDFVTLSALTTGAGLLSGFIKPSHQQEPIKHNDPKLDLQENKSISIDERKNRIAKAQELLQQQGLTSLILDAGTSLNYFTGIRWWPSERTMLAIIPASGEVKYVCPAFEEDRFRELITIGKEVIIWHEDENPFIKIVQVLQDNGLNSGKIAIEEQTRFFIANGIKNVADNFEIISGNTVVIPCRQIKSKNEIALMQKAADITVEAIKYAIRNLREGMTPQDISNLIAKEHQKQGSQHDFTLVTFGEASAFPHGTTKPQFLKKGDIVLMDCGCNYKGYCSDITKTIVFGAKPTKRQEYIWNLELSAQTAGFNAAQIGNTAGSVDDAARKVIVEAGFGPDYKVPGLPHRTGHGIGMNGHEYPYIVRGNETILEEGMCFSIEPTIAIKGEFGIRLEDCVYMTSNGAQWFSKQSISINEPFEGFKVL